MPQLHNHPGLKTFRQSLRNNCTPAEAALWEHLKRRRLKGRKFRRQHSVGPFVLDFYCPSERLAIELDGTVHEDPNQVSYDEERTHFLISKHIRIVRITNEQVFQSPEQVLEFIASYFKD